MGDPLSIASNIASLIQLARDVVMYLKDVKDASKEREKISLEICSVNGLLFSLQDAIERRSSEDALPTAMKSLGSPNGPLEQFKLALGNLAEKLKPARGIKAVTMLKWPFQKGEVADIINTIERLKSLFSLVLQNDHIGLSQAIKCDVQEIAGGVTVLQNQFLSQKMRDIVTWLSPLNFWIKQNDVFSTRLEGTGEWLLEHDEFKEWLSGTYRTLWCPGMPGAGKTVLASVIINHINSTLKSNDIGVTFLYCSYKEQVEQTPVNLIASLLKQLVQHRSIVSDELVGLYNSHVDKKSRPSLKECSKLLQAEIGRFSKIFIIIDALDEYIERDGTRDTLLNELRHLPFNIGLLVTSRYVSTIEYGFNSDRNLEIRANDRDVERYLKSKIARSSQLARHIKADPGLESDIVATIVKNAQGMFLLARLHVDSLARKLNRRELRKALQNLPREIDSTYEEAMRRIESQDEEKVQLAKQVFSWISHSFRPLTVTEIRHALAVEFNDTDIVKEGLMDEDNLVSACGGLVVIDKESNIIRLVHYTTQQYFEQIRTDKFPAGHENITLTCITYLSFSTFSKGCCDSDEEMEKRLQEYPLLSYAAQYWGDHARESPNNEINSKALQFLNHDTQLSSSVQAMNIPEYHYEGYSQWFPRNSTGLHVAASFGLSKIVGLLLENGAEVAARTKGGGTVLSEAARNGHETVVRLLLEKGADVDAKDSSEQTALSKAAQNGHEKVVRLLLEKGANVNTKVKSGGTALFGAAGNGHEAVTRLLLDKGADINAEDSDGRTALYWAAESGHEIVTQLLLEKGGDVNVQDNEGLTALYRAVENGHEAVARLLLLEKKADVNVRDSDGRTGLHRAAENGHEALTRLLVENGAKVDAQDSDARTSLHRAAEKGQEGVVRVLLELGVDVKAKDDTGWTALHRAAWSGHEVVVRLLLPHTDVEEKDPSGLTAMEWAAKKGHKSVTRLLKSYLEQS